MKQCVINQFFGIGDIIFIEPICRHYFFNGYEIIFPVIPKYLGIAPYFPYITFVNKDTYNIDYECQQIIETPEKIILPIRWSKEFLKSASYNDTMRNKYLMFGFDLEMWRTATWLRNRHKENVLREKMGVAKGEKFNLINRNYTEHERKRKIEINNGFKNIEMSFIDGFTIFDWCWMIENATEIHTVNTSVLFLLELLELNAKEVHLYSRNAKGADFQQTDYLRSKKYILHD